MEKMEEMRLAAIAVNAVRNQRDKVKNRMQASRRELGVLSMLASCAQPLSEDSYHTGLRRRRFKVGHAAACQHALSSQVLHVVRWRATVRGCKAVGIRIMAYQRNELGRCKVV